MSEPSITDWISALSSLGAMSIAGITAWLAYRQYLQPPSQDPEPESPVDDAAVASGVQLLVFKTSKQRTVLKATSVGLECHLNDIRPNRGGHQWTISKTDIQRILKTKQYSVEPGYKARTGLFSIGPKKNWLYSKILFPEPEYLHGSLTDLMDKVG